jgi:hypothetical protein
VAVHGLGANPKYAWVWDPENKPVNWLVDCLPDKIPFPYRVMTFNYDSKWHYDAPKQRLSLISNELLTRLRNEREKVSLVLEQSSRVPLTIYRTALRAGP